MRTYVVDDLCESMILVSRCCQSVTALTRVSSDPSSSVPTLHRQFRLFIVSSDSSSSVPDSSSSVPDSSSSVPTLHRQFPTLHRQSRPLIVSSRLFIVSSDSLSSVPTPHRQFRLFSTQTSNMWRIVSTAECIHSSDTHSFLPWKFMLPSNRFGVGTPMKVRRAPSVPPRIDDRFGVSPARRIASSAYSVTSGCWSSTYLMFRYDC